MTTETEQAALRIAKDVLAEYLPFGNEKIIEFARRLLAWERSNVSRFVLTRNQDNEAVALTRQDDEGKIVEVLWERGAEPVAWRRWSTPDNVGGHWVYTEYKIGKNLEPLYAAMSQGEK